MESAATADTGETLSEFAERVERETQRRGFHGAALRVVTGDGAKWIWNMADEQFPEAIQIIDLFHAKGIFPTDSEFGAQCARTCRDEHERVAPVRQEPAHLEPPSPKPALCQ